LGMTTTSRTNSVSEQRLGGTVASGCFGNMITCLSRRLQRVVSYASFVIFVPSTLFMTDRAHHWPSLVHSRLDYCKSMYYCLQKSQLSRHQHIQDALARADVAASRSSSADHILRSLHWLKVEERIEYIVISTTYKVFQSSSPRYLRDFLTVHPSRSIRSSTLVTLLRPPVQSSVKITDRSFRHVQAFSYSLCSGNFVHSLFGSPWSRYC